MKGLPLTYNKDMQEDKEPLFDAVDTVEKSLVVMTRLLKEISFNKERMMQAVDEGYLVATDLADYLVRKGVTFRRAHEIVGKMVLHALDHKKELRQLTLKEMKGFSGQIEKDVYGWLDPLSCIDRRNLPGGTGSSTVKRALARARKEIGSK
jgi:argininosuccinate lyase